MKVNEYFLTEKFVQSHVSKIAEQPPAKVYKLTFLTSDFTRRLARPRILDVACGAAQSRGYFQEIFPAFEYVRLDFSPRMLEEAQRRHPGSRLVRFPFERSLPFKDGAVDLVFVRDFFVHAEHPYELLSECLRVTRRYVLFNFRCCRLPEDTVLFKFEDNVRFNLLPLERFLAHLQQHQGRGLSVRLCVVMGQPYYPSVYACPGNLNWVRDLDRAGAKAIDVLIEKTWSDRVEICDCTVEWEHRGFVTKVPLWLALVVAVYLRLRPSAWRSRWTRAGNRLAFRRAG